MPLVSRTFDQLIDFTRTSAATYVDASGRIVPTPASRNLLTFTQEFDNAGWVKNDTTITANAATAPDGTLTADKLVENTANAEHRAARTETLVAGTYTLSCYVKAAERGFFVFRENINGSIVDTFFNLNTGVVASTGAGRTSSITSAGNGWYRCAVTATSTGGSATLGFDISDNGARIVYTGTAGSGLFLWGAQLEAVPDANLVLGSELVTNGDFSGGSTGWTLGSGWSVSGGQASNSGTIGTISQSPLTAGKTYLLEFDLVAVSNWLVAAIGGAGNISLNTTGRKRMIATAGNTQLRFDTQVAGHTATIDNISVKEITGTTGMPTDYTRNNGGVYPPRFDYDPVTLAPKGLLIEEQRTNLVTYSEQFDNAVWTKGGSTVTANSTTSPDGTVDADTLTEDTSTGDHRTFQAVSVSNATAYTFSVYVKPNGRSLVALTFVGVGEAVYNISTGAVTNTTFGTASIQNAGNGWYRCIIQFTTAATSYNAQIRLVSTGTTTSYTGDGTSGIFIWGAQLEAGSFATSYIPTVASQVTRTADVPVNGGANFSQWYNPSEGTFVVEVDSTFGSTGAPTVLGYNSTNTNAHIYVATSNGSVGAWNGANSLNTAAGVTSRTVFKAAAAYSSAGRALVLNGGTVVTDTNLAGTQNGLFIGVTGTGAQSLNGHIRSIRYYPTRLSNAQLQALTA